MSKINDSTVIEAEKFVSEFLSQNLSDKIIFHTFEHAIDIKNNVETIGSFCHLDGEEMALVKISALFHDTGYAFNETDHEGKSVEIVTEFLKSRGIEKKQIDKITNCILATKIPQNPKDKISEVLCDADLMHFASDDYFKKVELLRQEWKNLGLHEFNKTRFDLNSIDFFNKHSYHTDYGKNMLAINKEKTLELIKNKAKKREDKKNIKVIDLDKKKQKGYSRGVESMFRLTARNQISLSSIADNKSNILISVNAIILSVIVSMLVRKFGEIPEIIIPTLIFLSSCLLTIVFAILSTIPNISTGKFTKEDIKQNKVNLLFFGNFYNMKYDEYEWAVEELMRNDEFLYSTMIKDQYSLGKVLAKKYKLLRVAYHIFMYGLVISVVAYLLAFINF
jgi:predicted metal-dependent HD superfamily phosphohydrolase